MEQDSSGDAAQRSGAVRFPAEGGFLADLGYALRCWRADPRLPLLTLFLFAAVSVPSALSSVYRPAAAFSFLVIPVGLFSVGFYGTQRIWYLRLFRGRTLTPNEIWGFSWRFLGRYLTLAILTGWPVLLAFMAYFIWILVAFTRDYHPGQAHPRTQLTTGPFFVLLVVVSLVWDFALTFATPALAFTTADASRAFRLGLRMIRDSWPAAALYVFFPPLALQFLSYAPQGAGVSSFLPIYAGGALIAMANLLAKGAVAAFYLRRVAVPDDGSLGLAQG
ncbi:MAG: hypothetical protein M3010_00630 [Candidatus Dormibacteraeota bacterium]|nr:hypothetical protein [Candidatus Dormibacteraeota bacterium]